MAASAVIKVRFKAAAVATIIRSNGSPWKSFDKSLVFAAIAGDNSSTCKSAAKPAEKNSGKVTRNSKRRSLNRIAVSNKLTLLRAFISLAAKSFRTRSGRSLGRITPLIQGDVSSRYLKLIPSIQTPEFAPARQAPWLPNVFRSQRRMTVAWSTQCARMACRNASPAIPLPRPQYPANRRPGARIAMSQSSCQTECRTKCQTSFTLALGKFTVPRQ